MGGRHRGLLRRGATLAVVGGLAFSATPAFALPILDQQNTVFSEVSFGVGVGNIYQQEIQAGLGGLLTRVDVYFQGSTGQPPPQIIFTLNDGPTWQSDANDFEFLLSGGTGWRAIDVSAANVFVDPLDLFTIGFRGIDNGARFAGSASFQYSQPLFRNGALFNSRFDMAFRSFVDTDLAPVPEPGTLGLLALGMGGLAAGRRRRGH